MRPGTDKTAGLGAPGGLTGSARPGMARDLRASCTFPGNLAGHRFRRAVRKNTKTATDRAAGWRIPGAFLGRLCVHCDKSFFVTYVRC